MGGKKKGGKKGGAKKKGGDDDGEIDPSVLNDILKAKVDSLKARLVLEQERRDNAESKVEEIREDGLDMKDKMDVAHQETRTMVDKMTTIYKSMEKQYNVTIEEHETNVANQENTKKQLKQDIANMQQAKEDMLTQYEADIFKLKERIDTMSTDFAKMLKTTLKKMQERIDDANQTYEGDQPGLGDDAGNFGAAPGAFG